MLYRLWMCLVTMALALGQQAAGRTVPFNEGWEFRLEDGQTVTADSSSWRSVSLPHDWSVEGAMSRELASCTGYLPGGIGLYRKNFSVPSDGLCRYILFEGVYNRSEVRLNGHLLGSRPNGYVSFAYDMTPYLQEGLNELSVRVDHSRSADSRWYTGSGIYRDVYMIEVPRTHLKLWGQAYRFFPGKGLGRPRIEVDYALERGGSQREGGSADSALRRGRIRIELRNAAGRRVKSRKIRLSAGDDGGTATLKLRKARLWSCDDPYLYSLSVSLYDGGVLLDRCTIPAGLRSVNFDPDRGFSLNGKPMKLKGVCLHHDAGVLGAAVPDAVWERRLRILRDSVGVNAIRTSHNIQAPAFYDICDRLGLMVMDENSDEWEFPKRKWLDGWNVGKPGFEGSYDFFEEWIERDVADMVRRDRNHPSIILWSVGNEVDYPNDPYSHPILDSLSISQHNYGGYDPQAPSALRIGEIAQRLASVIRSIDSSRPVTGALAGVVMSNETAYPDAVDVVGYNYTESRYDEDHARYPGRVIYGSENRHDYKAWRDAADRVFIAGQFVWTGLDYLGESRQWPSRGFGSGMLDFGGFLKPAGHWRASLWREDPVTYVGTSTRPGKNIYARDIWEYELGEQIYVSCYTNAPYARLLLDGEQVGDTLPYDSESGVIGWSLPFKAGTLRCEGLDGDGKVLSSYEIRTPGAAARLQAASDLCSLDDLRGTAHVTVTVTDGEGRHVMRSRDEIRCFVEGPAELLGLENGDNADTSSGRAGVRRAYYGRLLAYIRPTGEPGPVTVHFSSPELLPASVTMEAVFPPSDSTASALEAQMLSQTDKCGSIFYAYHAPGEPLSPAPRGYTPVYLSHYGRHGSRYQVSDSRYSAPLELLRAEDSKGNLTPWGEDLMSRLSVLWEEVRGHGGRLSSKGRLEHEGIAARMAGRFPSLLGKGSAVDARSSTSGRCIESMEAFCSALEGKAPDADITLRSDSTTMAVIAPGNAPILALSAESAPWWREFWIPFRAASLHTDRLMYTLFKRPREVPADPVELMQALWYLAAGQQDIPSAVDLSDVLTPREMFDNWRCINCRMYRVNTRCPASQMAGPDSVKPLLEDIVSQADSALTGEQGPAVSLRFGHDTILIRLLSLMGAGSCAVQESDPQRYHLAWQDWEVSPMAANLQMVFYRDGQGDILVRILLNERDSSIPALGPGPFYPWPGLREYLLEQARS